MPKYYDAAEVRKAANGGWSGILSRLGADAALLTNRHSPCPGCGGRDRFRFDDKNGDGTWICSGGGDRQAGDGIALVAHMRGIEWKEAVAMVGDLLGLDGREARVRNDHGVAAPPRRAKVRMNEAFDFHALKAAVGGVEPVTPEWFAERSPIDPRRVTPGEFLDTVFAPGERALVFTNFYSQGDFGWEVGRGGYRLAAEPGVRAVKSALPVDGGRDGVWFLSNPVSLGWEANPRKDGERARRIQECVTRWRYLVLECDEEKTMKKKAALLIDAGSKPDPEAYLRAAKVDARWVDKVLPLRDKWPHMARELREMSGEMEGLWLRFLAAFPDPIRAIYSSGGASWHALVCAECPTWSHMDGLLRGVPTAKTQVGRMGVKVLWSKYGADPGALTPVRLTRLPGCTRGGREQRLIYLNPGKCGWVDVGGELEKKRIVELVARRKVVNRG